MDICFLKKSALFLWIGKKTNSVYASLLFGSFCLKKKKLFKKKKKKKEKGTKGCVQKTEPTASATEQINLKGNPVSLLLTSMVMEITENYFKMRTRPLGHCAVILPSASPQFPNHVSSKNMSEWVCVGVSVCVFEQTTLREGSLNWFLWGEGQMFWCGQKKTSHHLWCENCSWADGLVKLSWFSVFFTGKSATTCGSYREYYH